MDINLHAISSILLIWQGIYEKREERRGVSSLRNSCGTVLDNYAMKLLNENGMVCLIGCLSYLINIIYEALFGVFFFLKKKYILCLRYASGDLD